MTNFETMLIMQYAPEVINIIEEAIKELAEKQKSEKKEDKADEESN